MDRLKDKLEELAQKHPSNQDITSLLSDIKTADAEGHIPVDLGHIRLKAQSLVEQHLIEPEELRQFEDIVARESTRHKDAEITQNISIVVPPPYNNSSLGQFLNNAHTLPPELLDDLNHIYFLHSLATNPKSVLPPGKSLVSAMLGADVKTGAGDDSAPTLQEHVEDIVHKAFWAEALEALSDPLPATQLQRLKGLYHDLREAIHPLLPATHPALVTLTLPLSPTNAPLRSAVLHLAETAMALRERCAPVRDKLLDEILMQLEEPPAHTSIVDIAGKVLDAVRQLLNIAEVMKQDLRGFVLAQTREDELSAAIRADAKAREREIVLKLWSQSAVRERWRAWLDELNPKYITVLRRRWVARLTQAVFSPSAIGCLLPESLQATASSSSPESMHPSIRTSPLNNLPPMFLFTTPTLLRLQNLLQALTIAAALRSLTRLPLPSSPGAPVSDFVQRIWTLLRAEAERDDGTTLSHLADEVVQARKLSLSGEGSVQNQNTLRPDEEQNLRAAVDRTLKPSDPVFVLLHKRLASAILAAVDTPPADSKDTTHIPESMRAGRERPGKRPRLDLSRERRSEERVERVVVKGFEDEVLSKGIGEVLRDLRGVVQWTEEVWVDAINEAEA